MKTEFIAGVALLATVTVSGCASVPSVEEMKALDGAEATHVLGGNTMTSRTDYGRWAEYFGPEDLAGAGKAWGDWGKENAKSVSTVTDDGEICTIYSGAHKWTKPELSYCFRLFQTVEGDYISEVTKNDYKPENNGKKKKVDIKSGDSYGLLN